MERTNPIILTVDECKIAYAPAPLPRRRTDRIDASKIADCLRCDFLPECHIASSQIRDRRRILRCHNLVVNQILGKLRFFSHLLQQSENRQLWNTSIKWSRAKFPFINLLQISQKMDWGHNWTTQNNGAKFGIDYFTRAAVAKTAESCGRFLF